MADPKRTGPRRGPLGDVIPSDTDLGPRTSGGSPPEEVEDRRNVARSGRKTIHSRTATKESD